MNKVAEIHNEGLSIPSGAKVHPEGRTKVMTSVTQKNLLNFELLGTGHFLKLSVLQIAHHKR
jgi:hypothetical protein